MAGRVSPVVTMQREMDAGALSFSPRFLFYIQSRTPVHRGVPPILRVSLPSSVKALCEYSHRHSWRCVYPR